MIDAEFDHQKAELSAMAHDESCVALRLMSIETRSENKCIVYTDLCRPIMRHAGRAYYLC